MNNWESRGLAQVMDLNWRVTGAGRLLDPVPWAILEQAEGLAGRYDFPFALYNSTPQDKRYRMLYLSTRQGSLAEKLQNKKTPLQFYAQLRASTSNTALDPGLRPSAVTSELQKWLTGHEIIAVEVETDRDLFVVEDARNLAALRKDPGIAGTALEKGVDVDLHAITSDDYGLTQRIGYFVRQIVDEHGKPRFSGILYSSHMGRTWPCLALFDDRISANVVEQQPLTLADPDVQEVLKLFDITVPSALLGAAISSQ